jgi:hypothetical protein
MLLPGACCVPLRMLLPRACCSPRVAATPGNETAPWHAVLLRMLPSAHAAKAKKTEIQVKHPCVIISSHRDFSSGMFSTSGFVHFELYLQVFHGHRQCIITSVVVTGELLSLDFVVMGNNLITGAMKSMKIWNKDQLYTGDNLSPVTRTPAIIYLQCRCPLPIADVNDTGNK